MKAIACSGQKKYQMSWGLERQFSGQKHSLLLKRTYALFPVPMEGASLVPKIK